MSFSSRVMLPEDWMLLKHFSASEFKHPGLMGYDFMLWLDRVRSRAGVPMKITSSARDEEYNRAVGGARDSAHTDIPCNAVDIGDLTNEARFKIVQAALAEGCVRIGIYKNGSLHLDRTEKERPAPRLWTVVERRA